MPDGLKARGWPAEWLNGWMASVGVTNGTDIRLSFSHEPVPKPFFTMADGSTPDTAAIAKAIPSLSEIEGLSIARPQTADRPEFPRNPTPEQYRHRSETTRRSQDPWLGATVTDLAAQPGDLPHSPFDAAVPKGLTLWERLHACRKAIDDPVASIGESVDGFSTRAKLNGLGFDARRLVVSTASDKEKYVDPVVEVLAFQSLPMFPVRGNGGKVAAVRGWKYAASRPWAFTWPVWTEPLSWNGIDALLDMFWGSRPRSAKRGGSRLVAEWISSVAPLGIFGAYGSIAYRPTGSSDSTRAFSSEELWMRT